MATPLIAQDALPQVASLSRERAVFTRERHHPAARSACAAVCRALNPSSSAWKIIRQILTASLDVAKAVDNFSRKPPRRLASVEQKVNGYRQRAEMGGWVGGYGSGARFEANQCRNSK